MRIEIPVINDVWMDNGAETLYNILKGAEDSSFSISINKNSLILDVSDFNKFKESIGTAIMNRKSNLIVISKDKKIGETKEVKKDYILIQEGSKIDGKVAFKEEIYNEKTARAIVENIFNLISKEGGRTCIVCGQQFSKPLKKLQQAAYPFVTKIRSLSGVRSYKDGEAYSFKEYFDDFCPICYLRGIIEWLDDGIIYRTVPGDKSILFLPQFSSLEDLAKFKNSYRPLLNKTSRYRNIRVKEGREETENLAGSFSTLLCFYEKFFNVDRKEIIGKSWAMMEVPFGAVKNIKLNTITLEESILQIIKELTENQISIYKGIIAEMFFFYDIPKGAPIDWDLTNEIRENISEAILEDDFRSFAKNILPRKGGHVGYSKDTRKNLEDLIYAWRLKNMGLNEDQLKTIKSAGKTIAAASKDHRSLLYKLDKAKDKTALLDAIRQISRRIAGLTPEEKEKYTGFIYPPSLEEIVSLLEKHESNDKFVDDIKNTLVIFSCVEFSRLD
ncbi:MAG: hypothetical protein HY832_04165 [Candidatus Aenigmarchaeota archaeon]|nr:hypothetical protein [Candidatus Aenigmarchaeota archaeon]